MTAPQLTALNPTEISRTYVYPDGHVIALKNITHLAVSPQSGNHRLKTGDGKLHIVAPGWRHIEIDAKEFTV